jgi:RNA polymerase sigma-70 factor (ECF subfamily)
MSAMPQSASIRGAAVTATPLSLLDRLRSQPDQTSWRLLVELYTPLIRTTLLRFGVPVSDVDDLQQDVLGVLVRELLAFEHNGRAGAFRCWLRTIVVHRLHGWWRARPAAPTSQVEEELANLEDPESDLSRQWDYDHDRHVLQRLLGILEPEFAASTWQAFRRQVLDELPASAAAAELGLSINAVLIAKSRVLRRLREEARGLTD